MEDKEGKVITWLTEIIETMSTYTDNPKSDETECEIVNLARDALSVIYELKEARDNTVIMDGPVVFHNIDCPRCRFQYQVKIYASRVGGRCDRCKNYDDLHGSCLPDGTKIDGVCGMFCDWVDRDGYCYKFEKRTD